MCVCVCVYVCVCVCVCLYVCAIEEKELESDMLLRHQPTPPVKRQQQQ